MPPEESLYPTDWVRIAEKDLGRVSKLLKDQDAELAGFCLQQAVEKFLKAYLLKHGWKLRRIHNLDTLLDDAISINPSFVTFHKVCIRITSFYFLERYLSFDVQIIEDDLVTCLNEVKPLIEAIRQDFHQTKS
jgi:HEPN domain-containing protein